MVCCCIPFCTSKSGKSSGITFHDFPVDPNLRQQWLKVIPRADFEPNLNSYSQAVCSLHFQDEDYRPGLKIRRLKPFRVPSIFPSYRAYKAPKVQLPRKLIEKKFTQPKSRKSVEEKQSEHLEIGDNTSSMVHYCCVPYCNSGSKSVPGVSFHEIPSNIEQRCKWLKAIPRKDWFPNHNSNYSRVCSLHFLPSDFKSNLKRRFLMPKAVPSIFPRHQYIPGSNKKWKKCAIDEKNRKVTDEASADLLEGIDLLMEENISVSKSIGLHGGTHILSNAEDQVTILIHYHTENLATTEYGTALDVVCWLHQQKRLSHVYFTETHPSNQGDQLTAHELVHEKIPATLVCDSMVSALLHTKKITAVVVGAHKVTANGDTASEIGTYHIALSAQYHSVPFYVASPSNIIDMTLENGSLIPVEERPLSDMSKFIAQKFAANGIDCWNPAIDVTPAELITGGFITEHGVLPASSLKKLEKSLFHSESSS